MTDVHAPRPADKNPYRTARTRQASLAAHANRAGRWGFTAAEFLAFERAAPRWPVGMRRFRLPMIRLGRGSRGVTRTFEALAEHATGRDAPIGWRALLDVDVRHELHLATGDAAHVRGLSWAIADADAERPPRRLRAELFLADALLALAWMFPDFIQEARECAALGYVVIGPAGTPVQSPVVYWDARAGMPKIALTERDEALEDAAVRIPLLNRAFAPSP